MAGMLCVYFIKIQVLHGCRQSVLSEVRSTPLTDEIPEVNLYLTTYSSVAQKLHVGAKTSPYGPYDLGL